MRCYTVIGGDTNDKKPHSWLGGVSVVEDSATRQKRFIKTDVRRGERILTEFANEEEAEDYFDDFPYWDGEKLFPASLYNLFPADLPIEQYSVRTVAVAGKNYPLTRYVLAVQGVFSALKKRLEQALGEKIKDAEARYFVLRSIFGGHDEFFLDATPNGERVFAKQKGEILHRVKLPKPIYGIQFLDSTANSLGVFVIRALYGKERIVVCRPAPSLVEIDVFARKYHCSEEVIEAVIITPCSNFGCFSSSVELFFKKKPGLPNKELAKLMKRHKSRISQIVNSRNFRRMEALIPITDDPNNPARYYNCVRSCVPYASKEPFFLDFAVSDFVFNTVFPQENPSSALADILEGFDAKTVFDDCIRKGKV